MVHNKSKHCYQCPIMFQVAFFWRSRLLLTSARRSCNKPPLRRCCATLHRRKHNERSSSRLLLNTANSCYINSTMQALGLMNARGLDFTHIEPVLLLMRAETNPRPLNLYTSFALRSLAIGWRFDGRQHDAAEFFDSITATAFGDLQPTP